MSNGSSRVGAGEWIYKKELGVMALSIDNIYAFVAEDEAGEGIIAFSAPDPANPGCTMMIPCIGADWKRIEALAPMARKIAAMQGKTLKLLKFTTREDISNFVP